MSTFNDLATNPSSEKINLVTIDSVKLHKIFSPVIATIYALDVKFFIVGVKNGQINLTQASNSSLGLNQFYYSPLDGLLFINVGADPRTQDISVTYRHFFSNTPVIAAWDLANGQAVEWLPLINSIGSVGQQLDDESTGIVLESQSSVDLINSEGFFDSIFDMHIWENKPVAFYQWFGSLPITEARKIFVGVIENKSFEPDKVVFRVKDFVFRLRDNLIMPSFEVGNERIAPSAQGKPKRRIYGQVKNLKCTGIDSIIDGFRPSGIVNIAAGSNLMIGSGSVFLEDLTPEDEIEIIKEGITYKFGIESVDSNTQVTLNKFSEETFTNTVINVIPQIPYSNFNRFWSIAGHRIREAKFTILQVTAPNRYAVDTTEDFAAGDQVLINVDLVTIRRISGNEIVLESALSPIPPVGEQGLKLPVQRVFYGKKEFIFGRDWVFEQFNNEAKILFQYQAEFNVAEEQLLGVNVQFTFGSRSIVTGSVVDFRTILKPRDWIRKNSIISGDNNWYEILEVKEQEIILRSMFSGSSGLASAQIKVLDIISDDALITCDCLGLEEDGKWVKTPSQVVEHLLRNDAGFSNLNMDTFNQAKDDANFTMSLALPLDELGAVPKIRDVITLVNESVFGSLYGDSSLNISYSILNSDKPPIGEVVRDDDIISFQTDTRTEIYNKIKVNYRPFIDVYSGSSSFNVIELDNDFVNNLVGVGATLERTVYLYDAVPAEIIAQRLALFRSLANTTVSIKSKMNLYLKNVNDKIFLNLDRLFRRFTGGDRRKLAIITGVKKSSYEVDITLSDLGNIFNRVPGIAPDTASDFISAENDEKILYGYVVDNDVLTPNPEDDSTLGANIIG